MRYRKLTLQGFKSFTEKEIFPLDRSGGLYFLTGRNDVEPQLGANGSGKSSLWDGLFWVLFGKTPRNLKASAVKNWYSALKCEGSLIFEDRYGVDQELKRTWSPNTLTLSSDGNDFRNVTQEELNDIFGINSEAFLHSILMGQFVQMFFDLQPTDKLSLFSQILDLDVWLKRSDKAKKKVRALESDISDLELGISKQLGIIESTEQSLIDTERALDIWEEDQITYIKKCQDDLSAATSDNDHLEEKEETLLGKVETAEEALSRRTAEVKKTQEVLDKENDIKSRLDTKIVACNREVTKLEKEEESLKKLEGASCPTCQQKVSEKHVDTCSTKIEATLLGINEEREELMCAWEAADKRTQDLRQGKQADEVFESDARETLQQSNDRLIKLRAKIVASKKEEKRLIELIKTETDKKNPHEEMAAKQEDILKRSEENKEDLQKQVTTTQDQQRLYKYWIDGFKNVRLFLLEEALSQLEVEVNNNLYQFGLRDWNIRFAVESETKSGTLKKGFNVEIQSPYNTESVPWESWSGGESQRLRLAGTIGLASLILERSGIESNIEVYDEPSTWLSEEGIEDLLDLLYTRARETGKQVWIIDHRSLDYGGFAETVTVVKDEKGSYIE